MHPYAKKADSIVGAQQTIARVANVLGADGVVPARPRSLAEFLTQIKQQAPNDVKDGIGTIAGAAAGAILWGEHRVLGGIGGASLGRNVPALFRPHERRMAFCNMGVTASGVLGSLMLPQYPKMGFILGWLVGGLAVYGGKLR